MAKKFIPIYRHHARWKALQALYQAILSELPSIEIEKQFLESEDFKKVDVEYFRKLFTNTWLSRDKWDALFEVYITNRELNDLDPIELSLLRLATYELAECLETPYRVVIDEALELSKLFAATESYKFINGVLDPLARQLRSIEMNHHHS